MNLNYYYNRGYYKWLEEANVENWNIEAANKKLIDKRYKKSDEIIELCEEGQCFSLTTAYPGLLMGLGALHITQKEGAAKELKLGYFFDYTTGMPYIPASEIKGMLRSIFHLYPEYITEFCESKPDVMEKITDLKKTIQKAIEEMEEEIFSGGVDVFFSAVPHAVNGNFLIGIDYITPHTSKIEEMVGLKSPDVISMVKVMPGVSYVFRFALKDGIYLDRSEKLDLFRHILLDFGIGAKTNVGFGILTESKVADREKPYYHLMESNEPAMRLEKRKPGTCKICGKPTEINLNTKLMSPYCAKCYEERNNG